MKRSPEHENNFDFLRLLMSLAVVVSHQYSVAGRHPPFISDFIYLGTAGVLGFFALSGYLVMGSWNNDPHVLRFAARRVLRMLPGLIVMTLLVVLVLGPMVSTEPMGRYFSSAATWKYFSVLRLWNFEENLPGVFTGNPGGSSVNASLWSIPVEVRCYLALLFAGGLGLLPNKRLLPAAILIYFGAIYALFSHETNAGLYKLYWKLAVVFMVGVVLFQVGAWWQPRRLMSGTLVGVFGAVLWWSGYREVAYLLILGFGIVFIGTACWPMISKAGRFGDLSYGTYIYSFPVQQTFIWATDNRYSVLQGLMVCVPVTLALAWMSWHYVEAPALRLKKWIRRGSMRSFVLKYQGV